MRRVRTHLPHLRKVHLGVLNVRSIVVASWSLVCVLTRAKRACHASFRECDLMRINAHVRPCVYYTAWVREPTMA